jgi:hypothetical protein
MPKRLKPTRSGAEELAVAALAFIAQVPERLRRFLDLSGLDPANLREAAADPDFLLGILDYVSGDEALLVAFATDAGIDANAIETARRLLSNGS